MKNSTCRFTIVYYLPLKLSNFFYILETTHMHTIHTYVHMFFLRFSVEYEICFKNKLCLSPKKEKIKKNTFTLGLVLTHFHAVYMSVHD